MYCFKIDRPQSLNEIRSPEPSQGRANLRISRHVGLFSKRTQLVFLYLLFMQSLESNFSCRHDMCTFHTSNTRETPSYKSYRNHDRKICYPAATSRNAKGEIYYKFDTTTKAGKRTFSEDQDVVILCGHES